MEKSAEKVGMLRVPPGSCSLRHTPEAGGYGSQGDRVDERFGFTFAALDPLRRGAGRCRRVVDSSPDPTDLTEAR